MGGTVHVAIDSAGALAGAIQSGLVKPLAVTGSERLPDLPDVPTVNEAMPDIGTFEARGWMGLFAPAATPDAVVQKVSADLRAALADPQFEPPTPLDRRLSRRRRRRHNIADNGELARRAARAAGRGGE
jgi:tripartite-type tricarboxylate transporter receptor subunit TctC